MAARDVTPTRSVLLDLKRRIKLSQSGHKILKMKRDGLILEFFEIMEKARQMRVGVASDFQLAMKKITIAKAKQSKLLKEEDYNKMLMMSVPEISHFISEAGYSKEMNDLAVRHSGIELLEYATYMNMSKQFRSILESANGELKDMVAAYLTKWDFENLKVVLRGKNYGLTLDNMREDLVIAGSLKEDDLEKLLSAPSIEEALAIFKSKTGLSVSDEAIRAYKEDKILTKIEDEITKGYYKNVLDSISGKDRATNIFRNYMKYVIDLKNVETIMKLKMENIGGEEAAGSRWSL